MTVSNRKRDVKKVALQVIALLLSAIGIGVFATPGAEKYIDRSSTTSSGDINAIDSTLDQRDGRWYRLIQVDSLYWFNENLAFESSDSEWIDFDHGSSAYSVRVYSFEDSKIVCPPGWRLPTVKEFDLLIATVFDSGYSGMASLNEDWETINSNPHGLDINQTGYLHEKKVKSRQSFNLWLDNSHSENAFHVHLYDTNPKDQEKNLTVFRHSHEKHNPKKHRKFPVRCVCEVSEQRGLNRP